ncbi:MAG: peptidylprolyl isomerase [Saprospiraceae bacterium]|nr:peptidylprolyl isomerase [Saprospiraceae bacterium]
MFRNIAFTLLIISGFWTCKSDDVITIETSMGNMKVRLFESTPLHKANFLKLVDDGFYNDLLFHRVIKGFMIQGGDPDSKDAPQDKALGMGGTGYTIPAEIGAPHFKGILAAARQGDQVNPKKESSGSQFYIVQGNPVTDEELDAFERAKGIKYTEAQRTKYKAVGGAPMLDMDYTAFGEVVEGLDVIDKIANTPTSPRERPLTDVKMKIKK